MTDQKERIVNAAEKSFARYGIKKTTMEEIARNARMSKPTLYYYFKSKEDIFAEVIRKDSQNFKHQLNEAVDRGGNPQEKLQNYVVTRMMHLKELGNYYNTLTDEYLDHYAFVENARQDFIEYEVGMLAQILEEGQKQGVFEMEDPGVVARNFAIVLKGLEYPLLIRNKDSDIEKESAQMLNILFKGIEVR